MPGMDLSGVADFESADEELVAEDEY